ncbi:MAG: hypothetical protein IPM64_02805 [Phycisphaerales bacterium]|nr:hypothetical protein [Phycisphaerales bacterium]
MEHRTFEAPTMPAALALVKKSLGADAVIIQTRTRPPGSNPNRVTIIAHAARAGSKAGGDDGSGASAGSAGSKAVTAPPNPVSIPARRAAPPAASAFAPPAPRTWSVPDADPGAPIIRNRRSSARRRAASPVPLIEPAAPTVADPKPVAEPPPAAAPIMDTTAARSTAVAPTADLATLSDALRTAYQRLVANEVAEELAGRLLAQVAQDTRHPTPEQVDSRLRALIRDMLPQTTTISLTPGELRRVAIVGPAGAGKTTTVAKLAAQFKIREGRSVALLTLDSQRLAAREQLSRYAEIIEVPLHAAQGVDEVHDLLASCSADLLLIDTPGVGPREEGRFVRLAALLRSARPHEVHLALPGGLAAGVCRLAMQRFAPLGVSHVLLTRLDEAVGMGVLLGALSHAAIRLSYVTSGQRVPTDLAAADADEIAAGILAPV